MKTKMKWWAGVSLLGIMMIGFASAASAQAADTSGMDRMGALAKRWQAQLGPNTNRLSSGAQNFLHLGEQWNNLKAAAAAISASGSGGPPVFGSLESQVGLPEMGGPPRVLAPGHPVSQPNITSTRYSGAVQSETSTAWCGKQAVIGFNDSGSFWEAGGFIPPRAGKALKVMRFPPTPAARSRTRAFPALVLPERR